MEFTKPEAFIDQICDYLEKHDYQPAYDLARAFADKFPSEMIAHFFVAKAAFGLRNYEEAAQEGRTAFNLSTTQQDKLDCALLASAGYYEVKEYAAGYALLKPVEYIKDVELKKLLFAFSLAMQDHDGAVRYVTELSNINERSAEDLIVKFILASM